MNLYLISRKNAHDYDEYDSAVVAAEHEELARLVHPDGRSEWNGKADKYDSWVDSNDVLVKRIGIAVEGTIAGVVCASFNAG